MARKREPGRPPEPDPRVHLPRYTVRESVVARFVEFTASLPESPSFHLELALLDYLERRRNPRVLS